jgi:hypothetical protein
MFAGCVGVVPGRAGILGRAGDEIAGRDDFFHRRAIDSLGRGTFSAGASKVFGGAIHISVDAPTSMFLATIFCLLASCVSSRAGCLSALASITRGVPGR